MNVLTICEKFNMNGFIPSSIIAPCYNNNSKHIYSGSHRNKYSTFNYCHGGNAASILAVVES
jgi:hypothetical protein